jgi:hypothetical protein
MNVIQNIPGLMYFNPGISGLKMDWGFPIPVLNANSPTPLAVF